MSHTAPRPSAKRDALQIWLPVLFVLMLHAASSWLAWTDQRISEHTTVLLLLGCAALCALGAAIRVSTAVGWWLLLAAAYLLILPPWVALPLVFVHMGAVRTWRGQLLLLLTGLILGLLYSFVRRYGFNGPTLLALVQTHPAEAGDFLMDNVTARLLSGWLAAAAVLGIHRQRSGATESVGWRRAVVAVAVAALALPVLVEATPSVKAFARLLKQHGHELVEPDRAAQGSVGEMDIVLLLGESTTRWHMSLYGYPYATNPRLTAIQSDLVWLEDAISAYSYTVQSVSSLMLRPAIGRAPAQESLIGRLNAMGVQTHWYSTQENFGPYDSPIRKIAGAAADLRYFSNKDWTLPRGLSFDLGLGQGFTADSDMVAALIQSMGQAQEAGGARFWVGHFTAAHGDYCRLLPHSQAQGRDFGERGENYFGDAPNLSRSVNCYDASVRHVDALIAQVMERARNSARPTVVLFAPDHGEDPDAGTGHAAQRHSAKHIEIPVLMFFNQAARASRPHHFENAQKHRREKFMLPWLHESILDLVQGEGQPRWVPHGASIFSTDYKAVPRIVFADDVPMAYDELVSGDRKDYLERARLNIQRWKTQSKARGLLLAHRSDTELSLMEAMQSFDGAELDIQFNPAANRFEVHHPPRPFVGLTLERVLEIAQRRPEFHFWLDWKNPSAQHMEAALAELERLNAMFGLKRRAILETAPEFTGPAAGRPAQKGYRQSRYLSASGPALAACQRSVGAPACREDTAKVAKEVADMGVPCVSFDVKDQVWARAVAKAAHLQCMLSWDTSVDASSDDLVRQLHGTEDLEAMLVKLPTHFWY